MAKLGLDVVLAGGVTGKLEGFCSRGITVELIMYRGVTRELEGFCEGVLRDSLKAFRIGIFHASWKTFV